MATKGRRRAHERSYDQTRERTCLRARCPRAHLRNIDLDGPRDSLVVFASRRVPFRRGAVAGRCLRTKYDCWACLTCRGQARVHTVTERSLVSDPSRSIREGAITAWPVAWHGPHLRDIAVTLGFDLDAPFSTLSAENRRWLLFTEKQPPVPVYANVSAKQLKRTKRRKEERASPPSGGRASHQPPKPLVRRPTPPARRARGNVRRPRYRRVLSRAPASPGVAAR
ncbi:hypothetical protein [Gemmatimonas sp.]|uniref:hypothetical protein n=1 Tax=Gemmatimonas sp. TaxID=1962908 RepID=UPI00398371A1